jgi:hypothetical protein
MSSNVDQAFEKVSLVEDLKEKIIKSEKSIQL